MNNTYLDDIDSVREDIARDELALDRRLGRTSPAQDNPEVIEWRYNKLLSLGATPEQATKASKDGPSFTAARIFFRGK